MDDQDVDHRLREIQREYLNFLDDEESERTYHGKVKQMIEENKIRIIVNVNDLRAKIPKRTIELLKNGFEEQIAFQKALHEFVSNLDTKYATEHDEFFISFEGSFGSKHVTPRTLTSRYLGNMVCVEGIVTRASMILPKVVKSVHYCPVTGKTMERRYTDMTSFDAFPSSSVYPTKDDDGNLLETEYGYSTYKDHQTITIQEMPEKAPTGQLPRAVDIICDNDLVDVCKPGDRVQVVGTYRCLPVKKGSFTTGTFRTILITNHIAQLNSVTGNINLTRQDVNNCRRLSKRKDIFELLSKSLAPSIHGHEYVKQAILCMLLGGVEKILPNGTRLRGDINILLIGDPSVAKSQLLRYVLCTAPRAIPTTGRGSSGVGLTAAVTTDQESGERRLEAGAMVLADRGVVCIDEFDKMTDIDRTAIHEVMEQGRVTISKAGIHARLNARCSVLAAANPVFGKYDQYRTPMENINLQDSLLSRFDLLFVMLDVIDSDIDKKICDHVVRMHRYRKPGEQDGEILNTGTAVDMLSTQNLEELSQQEQTAPIFEKYDALLHGNSRSRQEKIFTTQFMKKYINLAKNVKPTLTDEACEHISEEYKKLRTDDKLTVDVDAQVARTQPVTARTLESLIRLSTAHAKARLSTKVEEIDAVAAVELINYAIFKKCKIAPKKKKRNIDDTRADGEGDGTEDDFSGDDDDDDNSRPKKRNRMETDVYDFESSSNLDSQISLGVQDTAGTSKDTPSASAIDAPEVGEIELPAPTSVSAERLQAFRKNVITIFDNERPKKALRFKKVVDFANKTLPSYETPYEGGELAAIIEKMTDANQVMLADGVLFLI